MQLVRVVLLFCFLVRMSVSLTSVNTKKWHSKRSTDTRVVGIFQAPHSSKYHNGIPLCSVLLVDEERKMFGRSFLEPGTKEMPLKVLGKFATKVVFACTNEIDLLSAVFSLRDESTKLGLAIVEHSETFPHPPTQWLDASEPFALCCTKVSSSVTEINVRRAALCRTNEGVVVAVEVANASGASFLLWGNISSGRWSRHVLDGAFKTASHMKIWHCESHTEVCFIRSELCHSSHFGAPATSVKEGVTFFRVSKLQSTDESLHIPPAQNHQKSLRVVVKKMRMTSNTDSFTSETINLESLPFRLEPSTPDLLACVSHIHHEVVAVCVPAEASTIFVQLFLPSSRNLCEVKAHTSVLAGLMSPMSVTFQESAKNSANASKYFILAEDSGLFACEAFGDQCSVTVGFATLDPTNAPNRLVLDLPFAPRGEKASTITLHSIAPDMLFASNGQMGSALRCTSTENTDESALQRRELNKEFFSESDFSRVLSNATANMKCIVGNRTVVQFLASSVLPAFSLSQLQRKTTNSLVTTLTDSFLRQAAARDIFEWVNTWSQAKTLCQESSTKRQMSEECVLVELAGALSSLPFPNTQPLCLAEVFVQARGGVPDELAKCLTRKANSVFQREDVALLIECLTREKGFSLKLAEDVVTQLVGTKQLSSGTWMIETPKGGTDVLQAVGIGLLASCLDTAFNLSAHKGLLCCTIGSNVRSDFAINVAAVEYCSKQEFDNALCLACDLLSTHNACETEAPLDLLTFALLCSGRMHALTTVMQLFPVQWDSIFRDILGILVNDDSATKLFDACLEVTGRSASTLLEELLRSRAELCDFPSFRNSLSCRISMTLCVGAFSCGRPSQELVACLSSHVPSEIVMFLISVGVHHQTEKCIEAVHEHCANVVKSFLPRKSKVPSQKETDSVASESGLAAAALIEKLVQTWAVISGQAMQLLESLRLKMLYPDKRGRSLAVHIRTLEDDFRSLLLLHYQYSSWKGTCELELYVGLSGFLNLDKQREAVINLGRASLHGFASVRGTLFPIECYQETALRVAEECLRLTNAMQAELHSTNETQSGTGLELLVFADEVLRCVGASRSDLLRIKRRACQVEDTLAAALSKTANAMLTPELAHILEPAKALLRVTDPAENRSLPKSTHRPGRGWTLSQLSTDSKRFLINIKWAETLWPVELLSNEWEPVVTRFFGTTLPLASCAMKDKAPSLTVQLRKAHFATICSIAPPLRSFGTGASHAGKGIEQISSEADTKKSRATDVTKTLVVPEKNTAVASQPVLIPQPSSGSPTQRTQLTQSTTHSGAQNPSLSAPSVVVSTATNVSLTQPLQSSAVAPLTVQPVSTTTATPQQATPQQVESAVFTSETIGWWENNTSKQPPQQAVAFRYAPTSVTTETDSDTATSYTDTTTIASETNNHQGYLSKSNTAQRPSSHCKKHRHQLHSDRCRRNSHICTKHLHQLPNASSAPQRAVEHPLYVRPQATPAALPPDPPVPAPLSSLQVQTSACTPSAAVLAVPKCLSLGTAHTTHNVRLVDPAGIARLDEHIGNRGASIPGLQSSTTAALPPLNPVAPQLSIPAPPAPPAPLQAPAAPPSVFFNALSPPPLPTLAYPHQGQVAPPLQLLTATLAPKSKKSKRKSKDRRKRRSRSSSSSSSSTNDPAQKADSPKPAALQVNHGNASHRKDVMQFEDLNRLYVLLADEAPLAPGEVMYRSAVDSKMRLATSPTGGGTLAPSEQAAFHRYVDELMAHQGRGGAVPQGNQATRLSALAAASPMAVDRTAPHDEFLRQLAAQQHAMFQVQQDVLQQQQRENNNLIRRLAEQQQQQGNLVRTSSTAAPGLSPQRSFYGTAPSSPLRNNNVQSSALFDGSVTTHGANLLGNSGGLNPLQQAQLVEDTMDYRKRVLQLSEQLVKLQDKVLSQQSVLSQGYPITTPVSDQPTPPTPLGVAAQTSFRLAPQSKSEQHRAVATSHVGVGSDAPIYPPNRSSAVQTYAPPASSGSTPQQPAHVVSAPVAPNLSINASRASLQDMADELQRLAAGTDAVERASVDALDMLRRSSMYHSASEFASEQQSAIEALRKKAASIQSQLLFSDKLLSSSTTADGGMRQADSQPLEMPAHSRNWVSESEGYAAGSHGIEATVERVFVDQQEHPADSHTTNSAGVALCNDAGKLSHRGPQLSLEPAAGQRCFVEERSEPTTDRHAGGAIFRDDADETSAAFALDSAQLSRPTTSQQHHSIRHASSPQKLVRPPSSMQVEPRQASRPGTSGSPQRVAGAQVVADGNWWVPVSARAGSEPPSGRLGAAHDLASLFEQAKNPSHRSVSVNPNTQSSARREARSGSANGKLRSKNQPVPKQLAMYAQPQPFSPKALTAPPNKASDVPPATSRPVTGGHAADRTVDVGGVVLRDRRSLQFDDTYSRKQKHLLEQHTIARIAAVKKALST